MKETTVDVIETDKGRVFICSCSKVYKHEQSLRNHKMFECGLTLLQDRPYKCDACPRTYSSIQSLYQHKRLECGKEPQFPCYFCGYKFTRKGNLQRHMSRKHPLSFFAAVLLLRLQPTSPSAERKYICESCPRAYLNYESLVRHKRLECGKEPQFPCKFCGYRATQKTNLKRHVIFKHPNIVPSVSLE
ncbi:zinc finger E-box-binding homeobox 2-like [Lycorma delicatula]|uniref:zinc finger E-box-binding homeobox 2-like n=1 Tax=Lycorma delicatula TaxID=130591 RepID=UPI003F5156B2